MNRLGATRYALYALVICAGCAESPGEPGPERLPIVAAGNAFSCALDRWSRAWCWGSGAYGQLGNGIPISSSVPVSVAGDHRFTRIATGDEHACAVDETGRAWCWGRNDARQLGVDSARCVGLSFISCASEPVAVAGGLRFTWVGAAGHSTCGLTPSGAAYCWGSSSHGQLGGGTAGTVTSQPAPVSGGLAFTSLDAKETHACGITGASLLYCWGSNVDGQLGVVTESPCRTVTGAALACSTTPVAAAGGLQLKEVSAGGTHSCALTTTGGIYCWGSNRFGVLGDPEAPGGLAPVRVISSAAYQAVSSGFDHVCALTTAGAVHCWGLNSFFQLGRVDSTEFCGTGFARQPCRTTPQPVSGAVEFTGVAAGRRHSCGAGRVGAVYCWGRGEEGQLGDGLRTRSAAPVAVDLPR